ncbi:MAG: hypothetical protein PHI67_03910 [Candidatus Methanomethylophilaceae archaeon]|jgi:hypothetical protein|nr:hypothetical protein [Candidatus Methanomethylophilaceae archaeon]
MRLVYAMAKLLHTTASLAVTLISLSLIGVIAMSVAPLAMGGMALEENTPFGIIMDEESATIVIDGSYDIVSTLPYDITDINASISIDDGKEIHFEVFSEGPLVVAKNGRSTLEVHSEIFVPSAMMMILAANAGSEEDGLYLPLTVEVGGSYLERIISVKASLNVKAVISDVSIPPITIDLEDGSGNAVPLEEAAKITASVNDIPEGEYLSDLPESATITVPIDGYEVNVIMTKTGPDADGNYALTIDIETTDGTALMEALDKLKEIAGGMGEDDTFDIEIDTGTGTETVQLDPENVMLFADSIGKMLEALT